MVLVWIAVCWGALALGVLLALLWRLQHLKGLTALRQLYVRETKVTAAGVRQLKTSLPNVDVIW